MPIDLKRAHFKRALAHLVTRPARPRYQARTMHPEFLAADAAAGLEEEARADTAMRRWQALPARMMQETTGTVHLLRGPIVLASMLALAIGAASLVH